MNLLAMLLKPKALIGLGALVLLIGAYFTGVNHERERGEANSLRQQLETIRADKRIADQAARSAADKAATLEARERQMQEELNALREDIAARPEGERNSLPDAAYDRLYPGGD